MSTTTTAALDALYITDAQTRAKVPVAGDFTADGKWLQALRIAVGELDLDPVFVADEDGRRMPVDAPTLLAALTGILATSDVTPAFTALSPGGQIVPANTEILLVPAEPGRVKIGVNHNGADGSGDVWLGWGQTAEAGVGDWLEPGGRVEEFTADSISVYNAGGAAVLVTWQSWTTGGAP